jgi:hypothetical protein
MDTRLPGGLSQATDAAVLAAGACTWLPDESAGLKFGLLGPLLVCREETVLAVPAGKQRALLAALLLNAGRVVPADEPIEVLWDTSPPVSARASLHNYVKWLRKALGDAGHRRISSHPHGYMISVGPGGPHTDRFEALVDSARVAARAGSWEAAAGRLRGRYHDAGRPLLKAKALEAAAGVFVAGGDHGPGQAAVMRAVDVYGSLGAAQDVARLHARSQERGIRCGLEANSRTPLIA